MTRSRHNPVIAANDCLKIEVTAFSRAVAPDFVAHMFSSENHKLKLTARKRAANAARFRVFGHGSGISPGR